MALIHGKCSENVAALGLIKINEGINGVLCKLLHRTDKNTIFNFDNSKTITIMLIDF